VREQKPEAPVPTKPRQSVIGLSTRRVLIQQLAATNTPQTPRLLKQTNHFCIHVLHLTYCSIYNRISPNLWTSWEYADTILFCLHLRYL